MSKVRHPYTFVALREDVPRENWPNQTAAWHPAAQHERVQGALHSGTFSCVLETLTPLCLKAHFTTLRQRGAEPYLPGASIKGMVRTVAQMLGAGCGLLFQDKNDTDADLGGLAPCKKDAACLVCRVFGYSAEREDFAWRGKLRFHDSNLAPDAWLPESAREVGTAQWQSHGTRHSIFYYPDPKHPKQPAGWKVYRHAKGVTPPAPEFLGDAPWVRDRSTFTFEVDYENLTEEEFAVLQFALTLQYACATHKKHVSLCHKLGYGKSIGLGSCRISATVKPRSPRRYLDETAKAPPPSCKVESYLNLPSFVRMEKALSWEKAADWLRFPDFSWFAEQRESGNYETLEQADAYVRDRYAGLAPPPPPPAVEPILLPDKIEVEVTSVSAKWIATAVAVFKGITLTCKFQIPAFPPVSPGDRYRVATGAVDSEKRTFEAKQAKRLWPNE